MKSSEIAFEACWRRVRPSVEAVLRRRGAAPDVVDDVLQETSIRLFTAWDRLDHGRPLTPLARTIALNCLTDLYRRRGATIVPLEEMADEPSVYDLEEHALARARLSVAAGALENLARPDRAVLLAEVGVGERGRSSASKMARMRARKRLAASLDRIAAAFGGIQLGRRRAELWFQAVRPSGEVLGPLVAGIASVATAAALSLSPAPGVGGAKEDVRRLAKVERASGESDRTARGDGRVAPSRARIRNVGSPGVVENAAADESSGDAPSEQPPHDPSSETTVAQAGGANAKTREGQGHRGVEICTGESTPTEADDQSVSVNVDTGEGEDNDIGC